MLSVTFWLAFLMTFYLLKRIAAFAFRLPSTRIHRLAGSVPLPLRQKRTEHVVSDAA